MKLTDNTCRINGVVLTELKYENIGVPVLSLMYALAEGKRDKVPRLLNTHGKVTASGKQLSKASLDLFAELVESIERDLLQRHFNVEDGETSVKENNDETGITAEGSGETDQI